MPVAAAKKARSAQQARLALRKRLEARRPEIEQAFLVRSFAVSDSSSIDPRYLDGLRTAIAAAFDFAVEGVECADGRQPATPVALLAQARLAARHGIGLDTVLRRYIAGFALLTDLVIEEAEHVAFLTGSELKSQLQVGTALFDRLIQAIADEYVREGEAQQETSEELRSKQVERLLDGELVDRSAIDYDFGGFHLALIVSGNRGREVLRALAHELNYRSLSVSRPDGVRWAWLGSRRQPDFAELQARLSSEPRPEITLSLGEPAEGIHGWRTSHRQARAAFSVAMHRKGSAVRYAEVALLAAVMHDELLSTSLHRLYLAPLDDGRGGGETKRQALRAYFFAKRNVSSAAAALGISRQALTARLRAIEDRIARPLDDCAADLETVLRIEDLRDRGVLDLHP